MILFLLAIAAGAGVGIIYGLLSMGLAYRFNILAIPNRRTLHTLPTPRAGGFRFALPAILYALSISLLLPYLFQRLNIPPHPEWWEQYSQRFYFLTGTVGLLVFWFALIDDMRNTPAWFKLLWQVLVAVLSAAVVHRHVAWLDLPGAGLVALSPQIGFVFAVVWILLVMNAFNFMDGINGLAAGCGLGIITGTVLVLGQGYEPSHHLMLFWAVLGGALAAFHIVNQSGREFMGDCGSQFLGYLFAITPLVWNNSWKAPLPWASSVFFLLPFLYDVLRTLLVRALRGERLWEAHRDHLYQKFARIGWPHRRIVAFYAPLYILCIWCGVTYARLDDPVRRLYLAVPAAAALVTYHILAIVIERRGLERLRREVPPAFR
ncbi:MAG: hypothetical protein Kow0059_19200 [Candidatus Sumerlaeia bacterium]